MNKQDNNLKRNIRYKMSKAALIRTLFEAVDNFIVVQDKLVEVSIENEGNKKLLEIAKEVNGDIKKEIQELRQALSKATKDIEKDVDVIKNSKDHIDALEKDNLLLLAHVEKLGDSNDKLKIISVLSIIAGFILAII